MLMAWTTRKSHSQTHRIHRSRKWRPRRRQRPSCRAKSAGHLGRSRRDMATGSTRGGSRISEAAVAFTVPQGSRCQTSPQSAKRVRSWYRACWYRALKVPFHAERPLRASRRRTLACCRDWPCSHTGPPCGPSDSGATPRSGAAWIAGARREQGDAEPDIAPRSCPGHRGDRIPRRRGEGARHDPNPGPARCLPVLAANPQHAGAACGDSADRSIAAWSIATGSIINDCAGPAKRDGTGWRHRHRCRRDSLGK